MDLRQFRYYCAIIEQGQISKAAKVLNIAQPALSRHLRELEKKLGTDLIIRKGKQWQVTEAGELLYKRLKSLLYQVDCISTEIWESIYPYNSMVLIGVAPICFSYLATGIAALQKKHPQIRFRIFYGDISNLEEMIRTQKVDFAMFQSNQNSEDLIHEDLPTSGYSIIYKKELLPFQPSFRLKDLKGIPLILPRRGIGGGVYQVLLNRVQEQLGYNPITIESQDIQTLHLFIEYGVKAAALLPTSEVHAYLRERRYHTSTLDEPDIIIRPRIAYHKDRYLSQAAQLLIHEIHNCTQQSAEQNAYSSPN